MGLPPPTSGISEKYNVRAHVMNFRILYSKKKTITTTLWFLKAEVYVIDREM